MVVVASPPRIRHVPSAKNSLADDVFAIAELVGFDPMPWQADVIEGSCKVLADGRWAAREVGVNVPRQNGKGGILELIELTSVFRWKLRSSHHPKLVIHSAHEAITSRMHFDRIWSLIENTPELLQRVRRQRANFSHGQEGFKLVDGTEMLFKTRTKSGGRGLSCDHLFLDEAMILPDAALAALFPSLRARENPQVWYTGSAIDKDVHEHGLVFTRVRNRALKGEEDSNELAYFEWSLDYEDPDLVPEEVFHSEEAWQAATPAMGILIDYDYIKTEVKALPRRTAAVELFGVGDYPDPDGIGDSPISPEAWGECEFPESTLLDPVCLAFDTSPGRRTSLAAAGRTFDHFGHVEVIEKLPGTAWLPERLEQLIASHEVALIVCDDSGPAKSIVPAIEALGIAVTTISAAEHAQACGMLVDMVNAKTMRHVGSLDLWNAIRGASTRPLGDRWAWSRKSSSVDIAPLVASTLALWAAMGQPEDSDGVFVY